MSHRYNYFLLFFLLCGSVSGAPDSGGLIRSCSQIIRNIRTSTSAREAQRIVRLVSADDAPAYHLGEPDEGVTSGKRRISAGNKAAYSLDRNHGTKWNEFWKVVASTDLEVDPENPGLPYSQNKFIRYMIVRRPLGEYIAYAFNFEEARRLQLQNDGYYTWAFDEVSLPDELVQRFNKKRTSIENTSLPRFAPQLSNRRWRNEVVKQMIYSQLETSSEFDSAAREDLGRSILSGAFFGLGAIRISLIKQFRRMNSELMETLRNERKLTIKDLQDFNERLVNASPMVAIEDRARAGVLRGTAIRKVLKDEVYYIDMRNDQVGHYVPYVYQFFYMDSKQVPEQLQKLLDQINAVSERTSLIEIAQIYQRFIVIQPFRRYSPEIACALLHYCMLKAHLPINTFPGDLGFGLYMSPYDIAELIYQGIYSE